MKDIALGIVSDLLQEAKKQTGLTDAERIKRVQFIANMITYTVSEIASSVIGEAVVSGIGSSNEDTMILAISNDKELAKKVESVLKEHADNNDTVKSHPFDKVNEKSETIH